MDEGGINRPSFQHQNVAENVPLILLWKPEGSWFQIQVNHSIWYLLKLLYATCTFYWGPAVHCRGCKGESDRSWSFRIIELSREKACLWTITIQFSSVAQSCLTLFDPLGCSTPGFPVHHQLLELTKTRVYWVSDAIQPSHSLSSPSPSAFNLSQHQGLFQWVNSLHQVTKVLELLKN